jgi:hypothetical protein
LQVKRVVFLFNITFAMAILDLMYHLNHASFVVMLPM